MTGTELSVFFAHLIDENGENPLDNTFFYQLLNLAKNKLEAERDWEYLKKRVELSSTTLPADFLSPIGIRQAGSRAAIPLRPFDQYDLYSDGYYIDYANGTINGLMTYSPNPYLLYKRLTDDIAANTSPAFPTRFHTILAFEVAELDFSALDGDDLNFKLSDRQRMEHRMIKKAMISWDSRIKLAAQNNRAQYDPLIDDQSYPSIYPQQ